MKPTRRPVSERNEVVIEAISRARNAMLLLQGARVTFGRRAGFLDFEKEIYKLTDALQSLGIDAPLPVCHRIRS